MAEDRSRMMMRVYHRNPPSEDHPGYTDMYAVDAQDAVRRFPEEHSLEPFSDEQPPPQAKVAIPSDWRDLSNAELRKLAMALGAENTVRASEAEEKIAEEEERRAGINQAFNEAVEAKAAEKRAVGVSSTPPDQVEIPGDWDTESAAKRRALARKLGAPNTVTSDEADEIIRAEQARRG